MNRPSSPWRTGTITDRFDDPDADDDYGDVEDYDAYADYEGDDDGDLDAYADFGHDDDRRWLWVAGVAGIVLLIAVAGTLMILSGGDSGTTSATVSPETSRAAPYPSATPSPSGQQVTVGYRAAAGDDHERVADGHRGAEHGTDRSRAAGRGRSAHGDLHGDRQPPADRPGHHRLHRPAGRTADRRQRRAAVVEEVVLDPGVDLSSVTATSLGGQLNCAITDGAGATLAAQNNNTMIANCTR